MSPLQKDNYHHGNLKAELIKNGLKILDEEGYEAFSLRKVAKACNVTQTSAYRHFASKDDLVMAIALEIAHKFDECLKEADKKFKGEPDKQLREIGCAYVEFFVQNPEYMRIMFLSDVFKRLMGDVHPHTYPQAEEGAFNRANSEINNSFQTFYSAVLRYQNADVGKKYAQLSVEEMALYLWGLVHGMAVLISRNELPLSGDPMEHVRKLLFFEDIL